MEYIRDLDVGELFANYSYSYVNVYLGDAHRHEFCLWPSAYLQKETKREDVDISENDMDNVYITKNLYRGIAKYYA